MSWWGAVLVCAPAGLVAVWALFAAGCWWAEWLQRCLTGRGECGCENNQGET